MMPSSVDELRDLVLRSNAAGTRLFPVDQKKPLIPGYLGDGPFTTAQITRCPWESATGLGLALPTGCVALDVDHKHGARRGLEHLGLLQERFGPLPPTARQRTPSGGWHLVFELPRPVQAFHGRVPLPDGGYADIDVVHRGHRYLKIYDPEMFDQEFALLPDAWADWIDKATTTVSSVRSMRSSGKGVPTALADATKGVRNKTLNEEVFSLAGRGDWSAQVEAAVSATARDIGLEDGEVTRTITSATTAGTRYQEQADAWYMTLLTDERVSKRSRTNLYAAARHFHDLACGHGLVVGMSNRELGERIGTSRKTAGKVINRLRKLGYLKRASKRGVRATSYQLVIPECAKGATPTSPSSAVSAVGVWSLQQESVGVAPFAHPRDLLAHDAFIRVAGTQTMPRSGALLLAALSPSGCSIKTLAESTALHPSTVRRNVRQLLSAGLVDYDPKTTKLVVPLYADLDKALDAWAQWSGASGNAEARKLQHQQEREQHQQALDRLSSLGHGRYSRPSWLPKKTPTRGKDRS